MSTTSNKTIAIVGAGKLTYAIIKGLLLSKFPINKILVIGREKTDFSKVLSFGGITTTRNLVKGLSSDILIVAIQPGQLGSFAIKMQEAREEFHTRNKRYPNQKIISLVSNESPQQFAEHLVIPATDIVCATMDTNVAYGKGTIPFIGTNAGNHEESLQMLSRLGTTYQQLSYEQVAKGVVVIGAGKAAHLRNLALWFSGKTNSELERSIRELNDVFNETPAISRIGFLGFGFENEKNNFPVKTYLTTHAKAMAYALRYDEFEALLLVCKSFVNTVASLAAEKKITFTVLEKAIAQVATKDGCTEKGLSEIKAETITHYLTAVSFYAKVWVRTQEFSDDISLSLQREQRA